MAADSPPAPALPTKRWHRRLRAVLPWLVVFLPAVVLLVEMVPLLVPIPCLDAWSFVQQYQHLVENRYSWEAFFAPHYVHPAFVGKAIYFAVLHWLGGNVAILPVLSWVFSGLVAFSVFLLSRPLWKTTAGPGLTRIVDVILLTTATAIIFTAAQGEVWIWDFVFQNFIPGTCLAVGLLILGRGAPITTRRLIVAGAFALIATCSFGAGFFVPVLLSLVIGYQLRSQGATHRQTWLTLLSWCLIHGTVAWFALTAKGGETPSVDATTILDRPLMRIHFVLIVLGNVLGKGTVAEPETLCAIVGGVLLAVFGASLIWVWRRRSDRPLLLMALPWVIFGLYGIASAFLISLGRMHNSLDNALDERFATFDVFFVFGTLMLAAVALRDMPPAASGWHHRIQSVVPAAFTLFIALLLINWANGRNLMHVKFSRMNQERALLMFARVMPLNPEWMDARVTRKSAFRLASFLADRGSLPDVVFARDLNIESFQKGKKSGGKWARLDPPVPLENGGWHISGLGGLAVDNAADLILVTARGESGPEQIVALTAPQLQQHFFERQKLVRMHPEYYLGWSQTLFDDTLPPGPVTLRAYILDQDKRIVHPIEGTYDLDRDHPHPVSEG